jgi:hypothetical protein
VPDTHNQLTPDLLEQARFRKSRRSDNSGSCVEVADNLLAEHGLVLVRDSKNRAGGVLAFTGPEWAAFTAAVREGQFDL